MADKEAPYEMEVMAALTLFVFGGFAFLIWWIFQEEITNVYRWIRIFEMWLGSLIMGEDFAVKLPGFGFQTLEMWRDWLPKANVKRIGYQEIEVTTYVAIASLKYLFAGLLALMGCIVMIYEPGANFRRKMKLPDLMAEQAKSFPVISPFLEFNPLKIPSRVIGEAVPAKLPLFAEALAPEEWVAYNEIPYDKDKKVLHFPKAFQSLAKQLGRRWEGPLKLPIHIQALYAVFALKHVRKREESDDLLNQLALSWSAAKGFRPPGKLVGYIKKVIKDPEIGGKLKPHADKHAFTTTALVRCLARAREEGGVLASATFLWLRGVDRALWYPLNNLGRRSYHPEAGGAMVHYTYELIAEQKIPTPKFDDVIRGLEEVLKGPDGKPIPELDRSMLSGGKKKKK